MAGEAGAFRASVRRIAEFRLQGGDLSYASQEAMQAGMRGHLARQAAVDGEREVRFVWRGTWDHVDCEISGRADVLYADADPPCVEELKLAAEPPEKAVPVHRLQAVCYAFMLAAEKHLSRVMVRVAYIREDGSLLRAFDEVLTREDAAAAFFDALSVSVSWMKQLERHAAQRDHSIAALPFPYDSYRPGQREMAIQVYTAIVRQKRLFASLPTGTGKSAAALFPAVKALGEGKTRQIFSVTTRGTARGAVQDTLQRMHGRGLCLWAVTVNAKEKCCPFDKMRCDPAFCPRAKGYFDRQQAAREVLVHEAVWTEEVIRETADRYQLCPFEFSLSLCEIADLVVCDCNYVFDPLIMLKRIFGEGRSVTLLADEAHGLRDRVREMLSGTLDGQVLTAVRRETGRLHSRRHPVYQALTVLLHALQGITKDTVPALLPPLDGLLRAIGQSGGDAMPEGFLDFLRSLYKAQQALERYIAAPDSCLVLITLQGKTCSCRLLATDIAAHMHAVTARMSGAVYYSATMAPLNALRTLYGGSGEDALFALPSPFPPGNLLCLSMNVSTRYRDREKTAPEIAAAIEALFRQKEGKYIAFFPSYAYLTMVEEELLKLSPGIPLVRQERGMDDASRADFLSRFRSDGGALLGLCVLSGVFAEGIDLPGDQLIGAMIVGVGLPQTNEEQEGLRGYYQSTLGDGFGYAYRYPGMQKVCQAAGRVIRSEKDRGTVLLLDDRYAQADYAALLPPHWIIRRADSIGEIRRQAAAFWQADP